MATHGHAAVGYRTNALPRTVQWIGLAQALARHWLPQCTHPMKHVMSMTASSSSSRVDCTRQGKAMRRRSEPLRRFYI